MTVMNANEKRGGWQAPRAVCGVAATSIPGGENDHVPAPDSCLGDA